MSEPTETERGQRQRTSAADVELPAVRDSGRWIQLEDQSEGRYLLKEATVNGGAHRAFTYDQILSLELDDQTEMFEPRDPEDFVPRGVQEEEEAVPPQRIQEGIGSYHINEAEKVDEDQINTQSEESNGENPITGGPVAEVLGLQLKASCRGIPIASVMPAAVSEDLIIHNLKAQETESDDDIRCSSGEREYVGSCTYREEVNAVRGVSTFERREEPVNEESQTQDQYRTAKRMDSKPVCTIIVIKK
jgi:hypothetical protein